jgi:hypothetical protein
MKKIFLSLIVFASISGLAFAQDQSYIITDLNGVEYENNSVHVFNEHGVVGEDPLEEAKLHLVTKNTSAHPIIVAVQISEIVNTDGSLAQFCVGGPAGNCFNNLVEGAFYPSDQGATVQAESSWGNNDYFINMDPTNLSQYTLRWVELDNSGFEIPNTSFYLTYKYDEAMSTSDVNSIAIAEVYPTVVKDFTTVNLKENAQVQVLDMQGKSVKSINLNSGESKLNLSNLSSGVYMIQFKGISGTTTVKKIIVK